MDTISRHKSFLLTSAFLLLASLFTNRVDPPKEDLVPADSQLKAEGLSPTPTFNPAMESLPISRTAPQSATYESISHIETSADPHLDSSCIFCKIITGQLPSFKVYETKHSLAFLARPPVAHGHTLIIPKYHSRTLTDPGLPDEFLADIGPITRKIAVMNGENAYNIIQNNGRTAGQSVDHVHFHVVPKPASEPHRGLVLTHESWPSYDEDDKGYARDAERMRNIGREHDFPGVPDQDLSNYGI